MELEWVKPLSFFETGWAWVGQSTFRGSTIEISSKYFDNKGAPQGAAAPPRLVTKIAHRIAKALDNFDRDLATITPSLVDLFNEHWRTTRQRRTSNADFQSGLKLLSVFLDQGVGRDQYRLVFEAPAWFDGYRPYAQFDLGTVCSIGVDSPLGPDCLPLLPFPGVAKSCAVSPQQPKQHVATKVISAQRAAKVNWTQPLAFEKKSRCWRGQIKFRRSHLNIQVDAMESEALEWVDERLGLILGTLPDAKEVAAHRLAALYNDSWNEGREISATTVKRRVRIESIDFGRAGIWSTWLADDGLFGGHSIRVDVGPTGELSVELLG